MLRNPRTRKAGREGDTSPVSLLPVLRHLSHDHRGSMVAGTWPLSHLLLTLLICWGWSTKQLYQTLLYLNVFTWVRVNHSDTSETGLEDGSEAGLTSAVSAGLRTSGAMGAFHLAGVAGSGQVWFLEPASVVAVSWLQKRQQPFGGSILRSGFENHLWNLSLEVASESPPTDSTSHFA